MVLGPAIALFVAYAVEHGFRPWEKSFLAGLWFVPLIGRNFAQITHIHIGVIMMAAFMVLIYQRKWDAASPPQR